MNTHSPMDTAFVKKELARYAAMVEAWLGEPANHCHAPQRLAAAMRYSLTAGGKRIRPVLCLLSAAACGKKPGPEAVMPFAAAIECIHTYSLIHDDLPAMDDDDLRRGKPSCHKQFDEATAILAGDGLLTDAFLFMTRIGVSGAPRDASANTRAEASPGIADGAVLQAIALAAEAAGSAGMVGGQALDMEYTARSDISLEELAAMHALKTGAMLRMSCEAGAVLAEAAQEERRALAAYGTAIGAAFQIMDDILDVVGNEKDLGKPVGSDAQMQKITYPSLIGLEASKERATQFAHTAIAALGSMKGPEAELLKGLAIYIVNRVS